MKQYEEQKITLTSEDSTRMVQIYNVVAELPLDRIIRSKADVIGLTKSDLARKVAMALLDASFMHPKYEIVYQWGEGELEIVSKDWDKLLQPYLPGDPMEPEPMKKYVTYKIKLTAYVLHRTVHL